MQINLLQRAISSELQASIQYMWQHVMLRGLVNSYTRDKLKSIAITEMKHAEMLADRIFELGYTPTTQPAPIFIERTLYGMVSVDIRAETDAIGLYKEMITTAQNEKDTQTYKLITKILYDEKNHLRIFEALKK